MPFVALQSSLERSKGVVGRIVKVIIEKNMNY